MKLSVVIPARDEEGSIEQTAAEVATALTGERIPFEIVVVDDGSTDQTTACVRRSMERYPGVRLVSRIGPAQFHNGRDPLRTSKRGRNRAAASHVAARLTGNKQWHRRIKDPASGWANRTHAE